MRRRVVALAAGGTGGHLFPAEALSHALAKHDVDVILVTDQRAIEYSGAFPASKKLAVPSATPSTGGLIGKIRSVLTIARGVAAARKLLRANKPDVLVGFGGYPTVPPVLAASLLKIPTIVHEQNAVAGRANRLLAKRVEVIATGLAEVRGFSEAAAKKCRHVGNPIRPAVVAAAQTPFDVPAPNGPLRLVVTGGSQGARVLSDVVPAAIASLTEAERSRIEIVQQARGEDEQRVRDAYAKIGMRADVRSFFDDLPTRIASAHLVIARAGASTVAELGVIGRPSILVPLLGSLDQDQAANAAFLERAGGAIRILQPDFTAERLTNELRAVLDDPARLVSMAAAARATGITDAPERLAALVMETLASE